MLDLNKIVGSIKRIHNITKSSEKVINAMIVDYTYNPKTNTAKQHKLDYVTTSGIIGSIFVNEKTTYTDIEVSENVKKHLLLIKDSIIKRKKAYEVYLKEGENIKSLTIDLLKENDILSNESFEKELTSKLAEKDIHFSFKNNAYGKIELNYTLNSNTSIEIIIKNILSAV